MSEQEKPIETDAIRAAEFGDPMRIVATTRSTPESAELPDDAFAMTEMVAGASLIQQDLILKANAGAMLTFAVWSLPKDTVLALFKDAPTSFVKAYGAATEAYGLGVLR